VEKVNKTRKLRCRILQVALQVEFTHLEVLLDSDRQTIAVTE